MKTYSSLYRFFRWIRINSFSGLVAAGMLFSFLMKLIARKKYNSISEEYDKYIDMAHVKCPCFSYKMACIACQLIYGSNVKEFFLYHFADLNHVGRKRYITEINRYSLYEVFNGAKKRVEMQNKYMAYQAFEKYYKRYVMYIGDKTSEEEVRAFFSGRDCGILKPNMSALGKGVEIVRLKDYPSTDDAISYILTKRDYVLEELVRQTGMLRELHPQSVNTVRVYACRLRDRIQIFGSHLRAGKADAIVDNAGQGGVIISLTDDGIAWTSGVDEFGNTFLCHPDTGVPIPGMVMPDWDKAIAMIEEMMHVYPDIRFVGWDIAYTDQGWIVIEANDNGQFHGAQIPHHRGFMDQVKEYMAEL